jgi:hypothetical protein
VDSRELPIEEYSSRSIAYYCIQGRGIAAMIGIFCLTISSLVKYSINSLLSVDIKPDTPEQEQRLYNYVYSFIIKIEWIQMFTYLLTYISLIIFVTAYCMELNSTFGENLEFELFNTFISLGGGLLLIISVFIYYQKRITYCKVKQLTSNSSSGSII